MIKPVDRLPNLGPYMSKRLAEIGVTKEEDLRALGAVEAYARLKFQFGREISLNALWAMDAALVGLDWRSLSDNRRDELKRQLASRG